jgi:formate hydrogenlyase subunit 3/multisubunit Na+/H+ antiporter MnhD subunit
MFMLVKLFFTAGLIVLITEVSKRSDKFGGLIAAMPIITILAIL